jgi:hypothetical protein
VRPFEVTEIGSPEPWLVEAAASIGLDLAGLTHEVTNYFENHGIKRHGNAEVEKARGQLPVTPADIARIPEIVKKPDAAIIGIKRHIVFSIIGLIDIAGRSQNLFYIDRPLR